MPVIRKAVLTGLAAAAAGTVPWAFLVGMNTRHASTLPWAVPIMAVYLWAYWQYVRGAGPPRSTAQMRRITSRVNPLSDDEWGLALVAGILGIWSVLLFQGVFGRLVRLPQQQDLDASRYPVATVALWLLMSAVVSGVVEETSFRGFLQRPIERRYGVTAAILLTGLIFGLSHFTHPEVTLVLLPFYLGVAAAYGGLAYLTDSTLPGIVLHAGGDALAALNLFARGQSEWELLPTPAPLVWESGPDASLVLNIIGLLAVGSAATFAYRALSRARPDSRNPWLAVPLGDYEAHMALPAVDQARLLSDVLGDALDRHQPVSMAVLGCAGGNGFDRIHPEITRRVVGIDINPGYLDTVRQRFRSRLPGLELRAEKVEGQDLGVPPVDFIYAGLFFEHLDPQGALASIRQMAAPGTTLLTVLQLPSLQGVVSASPYRSLDAVGGGMRLVHPEAFEAMALRIGFRRVQSHQVSTPAGKRFCVIELTRIDDGNHYQA